MALSLLSACEEEAKLTVLEEVNFTAGPEVSTDEIVITEENKIETLLEVTWDAVVFPVEGPVTYTLQFRNT